MKRIANNVALQSLLYVVGGLQRVRVVDYKNTWTKEIDHVVFDGLYKDARFSWQEEHCKIVSVDADGDTLVIGISTREDAYH